MALEKTIHERIMRWANKQPGCLLRKRWNGRAADGKVYGTKGDPDLTGSMFGFHVEYEVKQPGEKPTDLQSTRLEEWKRGGAHAGWGTSLEDFQAFIRPLERMRELLASAGEGKC